MRTLIRRLALLIAAVASTAPALGQFTTLLDIPPGSLDSPVGLVSAGDGSGRLFIVEQAGMIRIWDGAVLLDDPFLDISDVVGSFSNEQGLLGLAFHPDYESNGRFFVNHTFDAGDAVNRTRIARYEVSAADPDLADETTAKTILEVKQDFPNHNGGDLHFGPDGYLYIGLGDGGSAGDPNKRAQNLKQLLGKMLRIDVDTSGPGDCGLHADYGIPPDNPNLGANACGEIWSYGLRNPWRFSFDRETGDLYIGDVGQGDREEVNFQPASSAGGENYEWNCQEGFIPFPGGKCKGPGTRIPPILDYPNPPDTCASVIGGYVYRGASPGLSGAYFYGEYCSGVIWLARQSAGVWQNTVLEDTDHRIVAFGEDDEGEIYFATRPGEIYQIDVKIFTDGFESGNTSAWSADSP